MHKPAAPGSAGMMAAGRAAELGHKVLLLEKNARLGEKLNITGGGRCNITNAVFDLRPFIENYGEAKDFLYSAFSRFGVKETFDFFERLGLPLVVEARNRAFPKTQKATDVTKVLISYLKKHGVTVRTETAVTKVLTEEKRIVGVSSGKEKFHASALIVATGGLSHPETGSTGDGFHWLETLGHRVRKPSPNVVPIEVRETWVKQLSGVSLSFMKIIFYLDGARSFSKTGKILFTHFGLSGPLIINSASQIKKMLERGKVTATIDVFPDTDLGSLEKKILQVLDVNKNKTLKNIFREMVPEGTAEAILPLSKIDPATKAHSLTKEQRKQLAQLLKSLPVTVAGLMGYDRAVVSDGGISLEEIDTRRFSSKLYPNMFILGDLLDINRPSGGYSLQLCWTSAYVAAESLARVIPGRQTTS